MMRIALAQTAGVDCCAEDNLQRHKDWISDARSQQADFIVFPELSLHGYHCADRALDHALHATHPVINELAQHSMGISSVVGAIEVSKEGKFYNTVFVLRDAAIVARHRKIYLPVYGNLTEGDYFSAGQEHTTFGLTTSQYRAAILTCADSWNPGLVYTLALSGCNLLLQPVASSLNAVEGEHSNPTGWQINIRHTAMTWGMYVVMVNRVGKERGATFFGQSSVIDPYGNCLLQLGEQSELGIVDIELAETSRAQKNLPTLRDAAPELIAQLIKNHLNG